MIFCTCLTFMLKLFNWLIFAFVHVANATAKRSVQQQMVKTHGPICLMTGRAHGPRC